ncbi:MAG: YeeE/YedE family protein [Nitrospirae bacterium]|nr:YeeE/YedE family protein [Nitrospirota bacterium]
MEKGKTKTTVGFALIIAAFLCVIYLIFRIKGYAAIDVGTLSDEKVTAIKESINRIVWLSGLLIGGLMGAVVQRSTFCIAAACHNIVTTNDLTQTRAYAMALLVAIIGTQILYSFGYVDISRSTFISSPFTWLAYIVGGFIFGVGIVFGGGCASRILVRAAEGNLGGLVTVMAFILSSGATLWGITARFRINYIESLTLNINQYLPNLISPAPLWLIIIAVGIILIIFMLTAPKGSPWRGWRWPLAGAAIGLTIVFAWWINSAAYKAIQHIDPFTFPGPDDPMLLQRWRPKSLTFALPDAEAFRFLILYTEGTGINFGIATVFGVLGGSFIAAMFSRTFNWVAPPLQQFKYNIFGGLLMGFGAVVAMGCNIGQGLSGISTLAIGSILTMTFIFIGAITGAKYINWRLMKEI